jgi:hypothetical protein
MKRNLLKGIVFLIGAVALSSCSSLNQIAKSEYTGDDVYYTKAQAGDSYDYSSMYTQANTTAVRNDDYYYYGDYQSRINRFGYYSPFAYDDDFYYGYDPYSYNTFNYNYGFGPSAAPFYNYAYSPVYDLGVYSAFDFGYGNYWGYDNFGYGNAYSSYIYNGGVSKRSRIKTYPQFGAAIIGKSNTGSGLSFTRGGVGTSVGTTLQNGLSFSRGGVTATNPNSRVIRRNTVYPGRPISSSNAQARQGGTTNRNPSNNTAIRPIAENPRTYSPPVIERSAPPSQSSGGGGSSGSSSSSGGGGRPVRP